MEINDEYFYRIKIEIFLLCYYFVFSGAQRYAGKIIMTIKRYLKTKKNTCIKSNNFCYFHLTSLKFRIYFYRSGSLSLFA